MSNIIDALNKNKWWVLGIALATLVGTFATFYYSRAKPHLSVSIVSEETIVNKEPLKNFIFDNKKKYLSQRDSILKSDKLSNSKVITLKIENSGGLSISENLYDTKRPFGIGIGLADIVCPPHFITSDKMLKSLLEREIKIGYPNKIYFPKFTLNNGENFDMQILVSDCDDFLGIEIYALGKIAGQDSIPVQISENIKSIKVGSSKNPYYSIYDYDFDTSDVAPK